MSDFTDLLASFRDSLDDFIAPVAAEKFIASLDDEGQSAMEAWLHDHAGSLVAAELGRMDRSERALARTRSVARAFAVAAEEGNVERFSAFNTFYVISADNVRRRVGEMTGDDHRFVADRYADSSNRSALLSAFHTAVARKVGKRTTADAFDEPTYLSMLHSILGTEDEHTDDGSSAPAA